MTDSENKLMYTYIAITIGIPAVLTAVAFLTLRNPETLETKVDTPAIEVTETNYPVSKPYVPTSSEIRSIPWR